MSYMELDWNQNTTDDTPVEGVDGFDRFGASARNMKKNERPSSFQPDDDNDLASDMRGGNNGRNVANYVENDNFTQYQEYQSSATEKLDLYQDSEKSGMNDKLLEYQLGTKKNIESRYPDQYSHQHQNKYQRQNQQYHQQHQHQQNQHQNHQNHQNHKNYQHQHQNHKNHQFQNQQHFYPQSHPFFKQNNNAPQYSNQYRNQNIQCSSHPSQIRPHLFEYNQRYNNSNNNVRHSQTQGCEGCRLGLQH